MKDSGFLGVNDDALRAKGFKENEILRQSAQLHDAVSEVAILWHNNLRFASESRLRTYLVSIDRHRSKKGDLCKANALVLLDAAQRIIDRGGFLWTFLRK